MDNIKQEEIKWLIIKAPLSKEDRDFLAKLLDASGESASFYEKFNELLIKELKRKEIVYADVIGKFNNGEEIINRRYLEKKCQLEKELSLKLSNVNPLQIKEGNAILDYYYQKVDNMQEEYKNSCNELTTQLVVSLI